MEWAVLLLFALVAATLIGAISNAPRRSPPPVDALQERRDRLRQELRDLDGDALEGRITRDERLEGRRAVAPELRAITEELRARGEPREAAPR